MKTDGQVLQDVTAELNLAPLANAAAMARSALNISQWLTYLPQDCVDAMVRQGWDRSVC
jgi:hypothetical protein